MLDSPHTPVSSSPPLRVLLADDHLLLLEGLTNLLEAHGIQVVGSARDGLEAIAMARATEPDVILMDIRMPRCDGLSATRQIKAILPEMKIVMLTTSAEDQDLFEAVKSGACGYLLKSTSGEAFIQALRGLEEGVPPFSPGLAVLILNEFARQGNVKGDAGTPRGEADRGERLTDREIQVLQLVADGLTYREVGERLSLSPRTVRFHMDEIMNRLHLQNRAQVLAYAGKLGLKPPIDS